MSFKNIGPVEKVLLLLKYDRGNALRHVEEYGEEIAKLLGHASVREPERAVEVYSGILRRKKKEFKEQCYDAGNGWKYCLYQYKEVSAKSYLKTPVLSAMRGYVAGYRYEGGVVVEARVLAFPFAKFFNVGETEYTQKLPGEPGLVTVKLDGTLIIVWRDPVTGGLRFNTRGLLQWYGIIVGRNGVYTTRGDEYANPYVAAFVNAVKRMGLWRDLEDIVGDYETVMFELVHERVAASRLALKRDANGIPSPNDPGWKPYILAKRVNHEPWTLTYVRGTAFPEPETISYRDVYELIEVVREWRDTEGVVAYYPDYVYRPELGFKWWNYLVKIKSPRYALVSLVYKDVLARDVNWRAVTRIALTGYADDLAALGDQRVAEYADKILEKYNELLDTWTTLAVTLRNRYGENIPRSIANYIATNMKMKWVLEPLREAVKKQRYDGTLKRLVIRNLPRDKDAILSFIERLHKRIKQLYEHILTIT